MDKYHNERTDSMKRVRITLTHNVPGWNFCMFEEGGLCRFCDKTKSGHVCRLYDVRLMSDGNNIYKVESCKRATAGFDTTVEDVVPQAAPPIDPKLIMAEAIKMYNKALNKLVSQGYPKALAEKLAMQAVTGGK